MLLLLCVRDSVCSSDVCLFVLLARSADNEQELAKIQEQREYAIQNAGDMELLDAQFAKARCYARIGDKEKAYEAFDEIIQKEKVSTGKKIDATMDKARVAMFWLVKR